MILGIKGLYVTLGINETQQNNALHCAVSHYAEGRFLFIVILSVIMPNFGILSVTMPNVIILSVVAP